VEPLERHPDDLPTNDLAVRARRSVPRGVGWALALAAVVLGVLMFVAITSGDDEVSKLGSTQPPSGLPGDRVTTNAEPPAGNVDDTLPDLSFLRFDGTTASLAEYAGTPLVINFWASTCTPCVTEMPDFEEVHQELGDDVTFLGINVTEGVDPGRGMIERTGITYDVGRDPKGDVIRALGGINLPTTVIVAADGTIVEVSGKQLTADDLRDKLASVLP